MSDKAACQIKLHESKYHKIHNSYVAACQQGCIRAGIIIVNQLLGNKVAQE